MTTNEALRILLLQIIHLQTQVTALRLALEDQGILRDEVKQSAMLLAQEQWGPRLRALEKLAATEELTLEHLLSSVEGPVQ